MESGLSHAKPTYQAFPDALKIGDSIKTLDRGLLQAHVGARVDARTWTYLDRIPQAHSARLSPLERPNILPIVVERRQGDLLITQGGNRATVTAPDTISGVDAMVTMVGDEGAASRHVEISFVNFDADQARGFMRAAESHTPVGLRGRMQGLVEPSGELNAAASARLRKGSWDPARTTVAETLAAETKVHAIDIPARSGSPIRIAVESTIEAADRVRTAVADFLNAIRTMTNSDDLLLAIHDFMNTLRAIPGVRKVDSKIVLEAGDMYIVEKRNICFESATN